MQRSIYIEKETLQRAQENATEAIQTARETIRTGTPEEIKAAVHEALEKSRAYRSFVCANYHL